MKQEGAHRAAREDQTCRSKSGAYGRLTIFSKFAGGIRSMLKCILEIKAGKLKVALNASILYN